MKAFDLEWLLTYEDEVVASNQNKGSRHKRRTMLGCCELVRPRCWIKVDLELC